MTNSDPEPRIGPLGPDELDTIAAVMQGLSYVQNALRVRLVPDSLGLAAR